ncbi:hypothetical protein FS749_010565 [Ceratobasidium sp. UAMH 11750]|nr:hypothetical protein FS749_010565 [Ceratobasidium sp. UAMH 11750]
MRSAASHLLAGFNEDPLGKEAMGAFHSFYSGRFGGTAVEQKYLSLPLIDPDSPFIPFLKEFLDEIALMMVQYSEIESVIKMLVKYELLGLPLGVDGYGYWGLARDRRLPLAHLPERPVDPDPGFDVWLKLPLSSLMWDMTNEDHSHFLAHELRRHSDKLPFLDPVSDYYFSSRCGSRYHLVILIKGYRHVMEFKAKADAATARGESSVTPGTVSWDAMLGYLKLSVQSYATELGQSIACLGKTTHKCSIQNFQDLEYFHMATFAEAHDAAPIPRIQSTIPKQPLTDVELTEFAAEHDVFDTDCSETLGHEAAVLCDWYTQSVSRGSGLRQSSIGSKWLVANPSPLKESTALPPLEQEKYSPPDHEPMAKKVKGKQPEELPLVAVLSTERKKLAMKAKCIESPAPAGRSRSKSAEQIDIDIPTSLLDELEPVKTVSTRAPADKGPRSSGKAIRVKPSATSTPAAAKSAPAT